MTDTKQLTQELEDARTELAELRAQLGRPGRELVTELREEREAHVETRERAKAVLGVNRSELLDELSDARAALARERLERKREQIEAREAAIVANRALLDAVARELVLRERLAAVAES